MRLFKVSSISRSLNCSKVLHIFVKIEFIERKKCLYHGNVANKKEKTETVFKGADL